VVERHSSSPRPVPVRRRNGTRLAVRPTAATETVLMEMRRTTYVYRLLKSSWGIRIVITGAVSIGDRDLKPAGREQSINLSFGDTASSLPESHLGEIRRGFNVVANNNVVHVENRPVSVVIEEVLFNETDFQADGLAVAVFRWVEEAFGLSPRRILETFDRDANRYCFDWI